MEFFANNRPRLLFALLLALHVGLATHSLLQKSVTVDEYAHLPAGLSYLQKQTFGLYHQNPPLLKMLAALPVLAAGANVDYAHSWVEMSPPSRWVFGDDFQAANPTRPEDGAAVRYHQLFNVARLVVVALSCLGAVLIFRWGTEVYGATGASASVLDVDPAAGIAVGLVRRLIDTLFVVVGLSLTTLWPIDPSRRRRP